MRTKLILINEAFQASGTISTMQAAKLFAVKRVAEYLLKPEFPKGKDYLHTQKSTFIAAGMVDEFAEQIRAAWSKFDIAELAKLNYTEFVKVKRDEPAALERSAAQ